MASAKRNKNWLMRMSRVNRYGLLALFVVLFVGVGTYVVQQAGAISYGCVYNTYAQGSSGPCVYRLQQQLDHVGAGGYLYPDGVFGPATKAKVIAFQKYYDGSHYGGYITPNGIVGNQTGQTGTWWGLCVVDYDNGFSYNSIGCVDRWGSTFNR